MKDIFLYAVVSFRAILSGYSTIFKSARTGGNSVGDMFITGLNWPG